MNVNFILQLLLICIGCSLVISVKLYSSCSVFAFALNQNEDYSKNIKKVISDGDVIIIKYKGSAPQDDIAPHFALVTKIFGEDIIFPLNSSQQIYRTTTKIALKFYLPVVSNYSCELICCDKQANSSIHSISYLRSKALRTFRVRLEAAEIDDSSDYSRLRCHGTEWRNRWCEGRNIALYYRRYFFKSPAVFHFPKSFIVPGPRGDPFDKKQDRLDMEPYVVSSFPDNLKEIDNLAYLYGTFFNYHMIWHVVFDFMVPLRRFIKHLNGTDTDQTRNVYVRSDNLWIFNDFAKAISKNGLYQIDNKREYKHLFKKCIIGIEKPEDKLLKKRKYEDSITFEYNIKRSDDPTFRDDILNVMKIDAKKYGNNNKKLVLLIDRSTGMREFVNVKEIADIAKDTCDFCDVQIIKYQYFPVHVQLEISSRASVIIGVHGCGLTHAVWMHPSTKEFPTHMIEILPYNYNCRNWYQTAAEFAGIEYHPLMNKNKAIVSQSRQELYDFCTSKKGVYCSSPYCHDVIRDVNISVDADQFKDVWLPIVASLKPK